MLNVSGRRKVVATEGMHGKDVAVEVDLSRGFVRNRTAGGAETGRGRGHEGGRTEGA